jgi:hypothetical protein
MYTVERVSQIYLPMSDNDFIAAIRHDFPENSCRIEGIAAYVTMWDLPNLLFSFSWPHPDREVSVLGRGTLRGFLLLVSPSGCIASASDSALTRCT